MNAWTPTLPLATLCALAACQPEPAAGWAGYAEGDYVYIAAPVAGRLTTLSVQAGQQVDAGALLFTLDATPELAARAEADARVRAAEAQAQNAGKGQRADELAVVRAQLAQAHAQAGRADTDWRRQKALLDQGFISASHLDDATTARTQARDRVAELEARLRVAQLPARSDERENAAAQADAARQAQKQLAWREQQARQAAPAAAQVADTFWRPGEYVPAGQPVVSLLPPGARKARFYVPEAALGTLKIGQAVALSCDGCGAPITARISRIATQPEYTPPVIYSNTQRARLVFLVEARPEPADALRLHPGQPLDVKTRRLVMNAIDVRGLTKRYGGRAVVDQVALQLAAGRICGFLGPNGSGKTTTIRMLCGLLTPDAGEGTCLGLDLKRDALKIKRQVGYMTQKFGLYEDLTIRQNLDFVARLFELDRRRERVATALDRLGLATRAEQLAGSLSGGWKQRLALAACLLHEPRLLLLDEPTAGVDPKARREFWDEIHRLAAEGITVLVSTHYMDEAERCHELAYIAYGQLLARGTEAQIIEQAGLSVWAAQAPGEPTSLNSLLQPLKQAPGVLSVAAFGSAVHVAGQDAAAVEAAIAPYRDRPGLRWTRTEANLEDVFISLIAEAPDNFSRARA